MKKLMSFVAATSMVALLGGCAAVNSGLQSVNDGLSKLTGMDTHSEESASISSTAESKKEIKKKMTDEQALEWLMHDDFLWNDNGAFAVPTDWNVFWAKQIHAETPLAKKAEALCNTNVWDENEHAGSNCQRFMSALDEVLIEVNKNNLEQEELN